MLIGLIQFLAKLFNLFFEFMQSLDPGIVIDHRPIGNKGGLGCISQCGKILLEKGIVGIKARDHKAIAVSADGLLQDGGQF